MGDPAVDQIVPWNLLTAEARRPSVARSQSMTPPGARGRGWALSIGLVALPYYKDTNPELATLAVPDRAGPRRLPQLRVMRDVQTWCERHPSALARRIGVHLATMPGVLDRLEAGGWITRERAAEDRRGVVVLFLHGYVSSFAPTRA
jgi:hypothetical protein